LWAFFALLDPDPATQINADPEPCLPLGIPGAQEVFVQPGGHGGHLLPPAHQLRGGPRVQGLPRALELKKQNIERKANRTSLTGTQCGGQCCVSGSRIRCLFGPSIRDLGWVKNQDLDPGSWMNNPDHISERLETIFVRVIILKKFFDADLGSEMEKNSDSSTPWVCSYLRIIQ
jgi:hypothetical protein